MAKIPKKSTLSINNNKKKKSSQKDKTQKETPDEKQQQEKPKPSAASVIAEKRKLKREIRKGKKKELEKQKLEKRAEKKLSKKLEKIALRRLHREQQSDDDDDDDDEEYDSEAGFSEDDDDKEAHVKTDVGSSHGGGGGDGDVGSDGGSDGDSGSDVSAEESDSSEDEVAPRNTIGEVPLRFYKDEEHIGYDVVGRKIKKKDRQDQLQRFLSNADDKKAWRKIVDEQNDEEVELTKDEIKIIRRLLKGKTPHADVDPYPDYVDWFPSEYKGHPLSNAPEPKRRFIPSKWEAKTIVKLVKAIREGRITFDKPKEEPKVYLLWDDDSAVEKTRGVSYIPAPKQKLPGHEESYNPSPEYIPTQEELNAYELMYEEDRPKYIPKQFSSLRGIPAYEKALREIFDRCLDLYLCARVRKKRLDVNPDVMKKKVNRSALQPYPTTCYIEYIGHSGAVVSISTELSGQWIASGSRDGTVRVWEVATGRCLSVWEMGDSVSQVAWNPELPILAVCLGHNVLILDTGLGNEDEQEKIKGLLQLNGAITPDESDNTTIVSWLPDEKHGGLRLKHFKTVSFVEWHRRGDYLSAVLPAGDSRAILIHQLSKKSTQTLPFKLHGLPVCTAFHPTRSIFFIATKKNVRVYNLPKNKFMKRLETGLRQISCIAVHPGGDNVIVGSREGKLCWFDMDLQSKPYRTLTSHSSDITSVDFHRSYPLFGSSSEDNTAYVAHGMVYSDLNKDPFIVPLKILKGHSSSKEKGVLDAKFHPRQPWLFTAGADSVIKLYCP